MNERNLKSAHRHSFENAEELERSKLCGCFYCLNVYSPKKISEYIDDKKGKTAICPYCGVHSVIGESSGFPITKEFLERMKSYWFCNNKFIN